MRRPIGVVGMVLLLAAVISLSLKPGDSSASTSTIAIKPNGTVTGGWTVNGTADNTCTGHCMYVDEVTTGNGDGNTSYLSATSDTAAEEFNMGDISQGQTITSFKVYMYAECVAVAFLGTGGYIDIVPKVQGATLATSTATIGGCGASTWALSSYTYNGTWTQADINSLTLNFKKRTNGGIGNANMAISAVYVEVTAREPDITQSTARVYNNANTLAPGTPLAAANAQADVQRDAAFRIRTGLAVSDFNWTTGSWGTSTPNTYKLQYAARSAASCSAQSSGWSDVQVASGNIRWNDNAGVSDGATISSNANDPPVTGTAVYETYTDTASAFTNPTQVTTSNTGVWDFSLKDVSSTYGTVYCFRIVKSDGSLLAGYTNFPSIVVVGSLDIDIVNSGGATVASPNMPFSSVIVQPDCQNSTATLGLASQLIRVTNNIATAGWTVSMAAADGPTAYWTNGSNGQYDYNDISGSPSGCTDGGDADPYAGKLTVNPATATLTPQSGCSSTGTSLGSSSSFSEGSVNAITLFMASSATPRFCYFSVTGIGLTQQIPTYRPVGSYNLNFALTVLAT